MRFGITHALLGHHESFSRGPAGRWILGRELPSRSKVS
eukprot:COSAG05_NODE_24470_length_251_cov_0.684211_1_plen_37_part_10